MDRINREITVINKIMYIEIVSFGMLVEIFGIGIMNDIR